MLRLEIQEKTYISSITKPSQCEYLNRVKFEIMKYPLYLAKHHIIDTKLFLFGLKNQLERNADVSMISNYFRF